MFQTRGRRSAYSLAAANLRWSLNLKSLCFCSGQIYYSFATKLGSRLQNQMIGSNKTLCNICAQVKNQCFSLMHIYICTINTRSLFSEFSNGCTHRPNVGCLKVVKVHQELLLAARKGSYYQSFSSISLLLVAYFSIYNYFLLTFSTLASEEKNSNILGLSILTFSGSC